MVVFGCFEQDNNQENGAEPIEWIVLDYDRNNQQALLLSRKILTHGTISLNIYNLTVDWENSQARTWLNNTFWDSAFSDEEKGMIKLTTCDNSSEQSPGYRYSAAGGSTSKTLFAKSEEISM